MVMQINRYAAWRFRDPLAEPARAGG